MYLVVNEMSPKSSLSSLERMLGKKWVVGPNLVDVFEDDCGFWEWIGMMNKNWDFSIEWVEVREERGSVEEIFFHVFILNALQLQTPPHPMHIQANPVPYHFHTTLFHLMGNYGLPLLTYIIYGDPY